MELLDFIATLAVPNIRSDKERYWRTIVNCFLVDRFEQIQLGTLPNHFLKYYGQQPNYDGKLSALLQEPEFKAICRSKKISTGIWLYPSEFLKLVLSTQLAKQPVVLNNQINLNNVNNQPINSVDDLNSNPFALLAQKEMEGSDQNYEARFGRLTLEELNCGICFDLLKEAVEGDCCKNIFCLFCIEQNGRKCPNCRRVVEWTANEPIRRLIGKKPVQCEYVECRAWSTVSEIEQHQDKCEFNPVNMLVSCQKCQQQIMRRLIEEHLSNVCEMVEVLCPSCNVLILRKNLADHVQNDCEYRRVLCAHGCGEHMTYKDYIAIHFNSCTHQLIKCTNQRCHYLVQRRRMADHLQECQYTILACQHKARGCNVEYTMTKKTAWAKHIAECRYMLVQCPYGCDQAIVKHAIKTHQCLYVPAECPYCHDEFKKIYLEEHTRACPSRLVECYHCGDLMANELLQDHRSNHCSARVVECQKCQEHVVYRTLAYHTQHQCPWRLVQCSQCKKTVTMKYWDLHLSNECEKRKVNCNKCKHKVANDSLAVHIQSQCPKRRVICPDCEKSVDACNLNTHQRSRCPERLIECELCHEEVAAADMDEHEEDECPEREVRCYECEEHVTARLLSSHQSHACKKRSVRCNKCNLVVVYSAFLDHQSKHCPERIIKCQGCNSYVYARTLQAHRLQVCSHRELECPDCESTMKAGELAHHKAHVCPERRVPCRCGYSYPARLIGLHQLYDCDYRKVACSHCPSSVYVRDLAAHEENCPERIVTCEKCSNIMTARTLETHQCNNGCIIS